MIEEEEPKTNGWVVVVTVVLSIGIGFIMGGIWSIHRTKSIWVNVPPYQGINFEVQETDTSININLK